MTNAIPTQGNSKADEKCSLLTGIHNRSVETEGTSNGRITYGPCSQFQDYWSITHIGLMMILGVLLNIKRCVVLSTLPSRCAKISEAQVGRQWHCICQYLRELKMTILHFAYARVKGFWIGVGKAPKDSTTLDIPKSSISFLSRASLLSRCPLTVAFICLILAFLLMQDDTHMSRISTF